MKMLPVEGIAPKGVNVTSTSKSAPEITALAPWTLSSFES